MSEEEKKGDEPLDVVAVEYTEDECVKVAIGRIYCCGDVYTRHSLCLSWSEYNTIKPSVGDEVIFRVVNDAVEMRFVKKTQREPSRAEQ
jgi:hypothetical protein